MTDREAISKGQLAYLLSRARDDGDTNAAEQLLAEFVACVSSGEQVPEELLRHVSTAFDSCLQDHKRDIGRWLGLKHSRRGHPGHDPDRALGIALAIWQERLAGASYEAALEIVGSEYGCGATKAGAAWKQNKLDALAGLRAERALDQHEWTQEEMAKLREICANSDVPCPKFAL